MNIRDLDYFVTLCELRNFRKAAEQCFVSQPALSIQIKKLEEELGVQLFERKGKTILVTAIGEKLRVQAQHILRDINNFKLLAATAHNPLKGTLKLAAFPTLAPYFFPLVVPKINKKFKSLSLLLIEEKTEVIIDKLCLGEIDAGLIALPVDNNDLVAVPLFEDHFSLAVSKQHALAKTKQINRKKLSEMELMLLEDGHCLRDQALEICHLPHNSDSHAFRATSLETLKQMVGINMGITLVPKTAQKKTDNLHYIPFSKPCPSRTIGMVYRKSSACIKCIEAIIDVIKEVYPA